MAGDVRRLSGSRTKTPLSRTELHHFLISDAVTNRAVLVVPDLTYHLEQKSVRTDSPISD
jgi:hypothetical protein